jgi:hypothetical protein
MLPRKNQRAVETAFQITPPVPSLPRRSWLPCTSCRSLPFRLRRSAIVICMRSPGIRAKSSQTLVTSGCTGNSKGRLVTIGSAARLGCAGRVVCCAPAQVSNVRAKSRLDQRPSITIRRSRDESQPSMGFTSQTLNATFNRRLFLLYIEVYNTACLPVISLTHRNPGRFRNPCRTCNPCTS